MSDNQGMILNLTVAKQTKTDVAGTLEKPCSGNLLNAKHPVSSRPKRDWTITHSLSTKPALQGFGSVPGGSVYATTRLISSRNP
jgi:hypothetical protein